MALSDLTFRDENHNTVNTYTHKGEVVVCVEGDPERGESLVYLTPAYAKMLGAWLIEAAGVVEGIATGDA